MNCPSCSASNPVGSAFCDNCGTSLLATQTPVPAPSYTNNAPSPAVQGYAGYQPASFLGQTVGPQVNSYQPANTGVATYCPACQSPVSTPDAAYCDNCGSSLTANSVPVGTSLSSTSVISGATIVVGSSSNSTGTGGPVVARLVFDSGEIPLVLEPGKTLTIGRQDSVSGHFPEVDLNKFNALNNGVGRKHANLSLESNQVILQDLGAVNGTYVNSKVLPENGRQSLTNGDELMLGKLKMKFFLS